MTGTEIVPEHIMYHTHTIQEKDFFVIINDHCMSLPMLIEAQRNICVGGGHQIVLYGQHTLTLTLSYARAAVMFL